MILSVLCTNRDICASAAPQTTPTPDEQVVEPETAPALRTEIPESSSLQNPTHDVPPPSTHDTPPPSVEMERVSIASRTETDPTAMKNSPTSHPGSGACVVGSAVVKTIDPATLAMEENPWAEWNEPVSPVKR